MEQMFGSNHFLIGYKAHSTRHNSLFVLLTGPKTMAGSDIGTLNTNILLNGHNNKLSPKFLPYADRLVHFPTLISEASFYSRWKIIQKPTIYQHAEKKDCQELGFKWNSCITYGSPIKQYYWRWTFSHTHELTAIMSTVG